MLTRVLLLLAGSPIVSGFAFVWLSATFSNPLQFIRIQTRLAIQFLLNRFFRFLFWRTDPFFIKASYPPTSWHFECRIILLLATLTNGGIILFSRLLKRFVFSVKFTFVYPSVLTAKLFLFFCAVNKMWFSYFFCCWIVCHI